MPRGVSTLTRHPCRSGPVAGRPNGRAPRDDVPVTSGWPGSALPVPSSYWFECRRTRGCRPRTRKRSTQRSPERCVAVRGPLIEPEVDGRAWPQSWWQASALSIAVARRTGSFEARYVPSVPSSRPAAHDVTGTTRCSDARLLTVESGSRCYSGGLGLIYRRRMPRTPEGEYCSDLSTAGDETHMGRPDPLNRVMTGAGHATQIANDAT